MTHTPRQRPGPRRTRAQLILAATILAAVGHAIIHHGNALPLRDAAMTAPALTILRIQQPSSLGLAIAARAPLHTLQAAGLSLSPSGRGTDHRHHERPHPTGPTRAGCSPARGTPTSSTSSRFRRPTTAVSAPRTRSSSAVSPATFSTSRWRRRRSTAA